MPTPIRSVISASAIDSALIRSRKYIEWNKLKSKYVFLTGPLYNRQLEIPCCLIPINKSIRIFNYQEQSIL